MGKIKTAIFDLDGTLSNTSLLTMEAFKNIAPLFDLPVPSKDAVLRATGFANPEFYYILYPDFPKSKVDEAGILVEKEELRVLPAFKDKLLFSGCMEMLERLKEKNLRLCIASTGGEEHVYTILEKTGIKKYFDLIMCGKPSKTEMLGEIINGGSKNGFIMTGDMEKDYKAARENGILCAGACYGYCKREISDFDFYLDDPLDLIRIIG